MSVVQLASGEEMVAGNDWVFTLTITRDAVAVDITGATVTASLWQVNPDKEIIADHAVALTTAASGIVTLTVTDTESAAAPAGKYRGDLKIVYSGGVVENTQEFAFTVRRPRT